MLRRTGAVALRGPAEQIVETATPWDAAPADESRIDDPRPPAGLEVELAKRASLDCGPATTQEIDHQHHDREDQQDVNEPTQGVRTNQAEQPEHEQNYEDCPKHV